MSTRGYGRQVGPYLLKVAPSTCALRASVDNLRLACQPKLTFVGKRERRLERETGIEPATNSLEGCDSTTELLPPSFPLGGFAPPEPPTRSLAGTPSIPTPLARLTRFRSFAPPDSFPNHWLAHRSSHADACERRWVAREGLEPSKPLGRQIYSLLRLTASLPRQLSCCLECAAFGTYPQADSPEDGAGEGT